VTRMDHDDRSLLGRLNRRCRDLRAPEVVMAPARMGAARPTRYSFTRTLLRSAFRQGWLADRVELDLDAEGRGRAIYRVEARGHEVHFVAFTDTLDESTHTDRVVAEAWEITAALVDGPLSEEFLAELARAVPLQENGRFDPRVLVLTRGNRSVRFYEYLVDCLADGQQPESDRVADAGYIMRSTAFYGNGKFGMRSFLGYPDAHPLSVPYRAQLLTAWLFRELSYDSVEHCARARGGDSAVPFEAGWRRFFGLGNATGLGLVPYLFKHPQVLNSWVGVRELALANVRTLEGTEERVATLRRWIAKAHAHFSGIGGDDRPPWLGPRSLAAEIERISEHFDSVASRPQPFETLSQWAEGQGDETCEMVVSLLIELDEELADEEVDKLLLVDERIDYDPAMLVGDLRRVLESRFGWIDEMDLRGSDADHYWWVISDNTEEPRRAERRAVDPAHREVAIDVALQVAGLRRLLAGASDDTTLATLLVGNLGHEAAVRRVLGSDVPYGEPRDNACGAGFLPLEVQRFQLAMYGLDNFAPKSTDWLRVTLFQGAPRIGELAAPATDEWVWPTAPMEVSP